MESEKKIVLCKMYTGDYLVENIGHEIINLYKCDNGSNYIYLPYDGKFSDIHSGKIETILMVRNIGNGVVEILGKAEGITEIYKEGQPEKEQKDYIQKNGIKYGGVPLNRIFENNKYQYIFLTFKAEMVQTPLKKIYIKFGETIKETKQAKTSLKQYISSSEQPNDYKNLQAIINDKQLWGNDTEKVPISENLTVQAPEIETNFFEICGIQDSELAFSNALAFFMEKYPELVSRFAKDVLKENFDTAKDFSVAKEEGDNATGRIDLLLRNKDKIVVIENKIKSHINGLVFNRKTKELDKTQLEKYYNYANKEAKEKKKELKCYLLMPNYNDIDISDYGAGDKYTKIYYSQIFDFLKKQNITDMYLKDFMKAMNKQTKKYDNDLYIEMKRRFFQQIKSIN